MKHSIYEFQRFDQILPDQSSSTEVRRRPHAHASTTKTPDYLIIGFPCYSFLFFTQRLVPSKSYIPLDLDRIYTIPPNLPQSLFTPLYYITLIPLPLK